MPTLYRSVFPKPDERRFPARPTALPSESQQAADPRSQRGCRRENDKKLQQLAFDVKAVLSPFHNVSRFRIVVLEKTELQQPEVIEKYHVIDFIYGEQGKESYEFVFPPYCFGI